MESSSSRDVVVALLNHASLQFQYGDVSILFDPWLEGFAFDGGWRLRYQTPPEAWKSLELTTHLFITHWHSDHFHAATLGKLAKLIPELIVYGNRSWNFDMRQALEKLGYARIRDIGEGSPIKLMVDEGSGAPVLVTRFPAGGTDNAFLLDFAGFKFLNYNDVNLPSSALRMMARGPWSGIDILFNNFNHAGTIRPDESVAQIKSRQLHNFCRVAEILEPRYVVPFASHHQYCSAFSDWQNDSLFSEAEFAEDLRPLLSSALCMLPGESVKFSKNSAGVTACTVNSQGLVAGHPAETRTKTGRPEASLAISDQAKDVAEMVDRFVYNIRLHFPFFWRTLRDATIALDDLNGLLRLSVNSESRGFSRVDRSSREFREADITTSSTALARWLDRPYGSDTFAAGGHFALAKVRADNPFPRWLTLSLLIDNRLSIRAILRGLFSRRAPGLVSFVWHRRREIAALLLSGNATGNDSRL